ncbi:MAG: hypothetical protein QM756_00990 [Polyangiaceae bacterium]
MLVSEPKRFSVTCLRALFCAAQLAILQPEERVEQRAHVVAESALRARWGRHRDVVAMLRVFEKLSS